MIDTRKKDANWLINAPEGGLWSLDQARLAVLMDIRDELKQLNLAFSCRNFLSLPSAVEAIRQNTQKPAKKRVKK